MALPSESVYPILTLDGNCMLCKNGDICFAYLVQLPPIYTLGESDLDNMHSDIFKFFRQFEEAVIHKQDVFLKDTYLCENLENDTFLQKATYNKFYGRSFTNHYSLIFISLTRLKSYRRSYFNTSLLRANQEFNIDKTRIANFSKVTENAIESLNNSRFIKFLALSEREVKQHIKLYLNGFVKDKTTDILFEPIFKLGNKPAALYAITDLDDQLPAQIQNCVNDYRFSKDDYKFFKCLFQPLALELDCNHVLNQIIYIDDHKLIKNEFEIKQKTFAALRKLARANDTSNTEAKEFLNLVDADENYRFCRAHINVLVWADTIEELKSLDKLVVPRFKEIDFTPYESTYNDYQNYYLCSIPGNAGCLPEQDTFLIDLQKGACLWNLSTNYQSQKQGTVFNDRLFNIPVKFDDFFEPYDKKIIGGRNTIFLASTGLGKSTTLNHRVRQSLESGFLVNIIDLGKSFEVLNYLYKDISAFIEYKEGTPIGLNPFLINDFSELTADKVRTLTDFLFVLCKKTGISGIDESEEQKNLRVSYNKIVKSYYHSKPEQLKFATFYTFIKDKLNLTDLEIKEEFFNRDEFLHRASEYVGGGIYSFMFEDIKQNFQLKGKRLIGFELENIRDNMDVLPVMLMLIRDTLENTVFNNVSVPKDILFEETAKLFVHEMFLTIIEYFNQTIRKHTGRTNLVLQNITNIPDTAKGNAILANSHVIYILGAISDLNELLRRKSFTTQDINQIKSLSSNFTGKYKYTELFAKLGEAPANVFRLELCEEAIMAYKSEVIDKVPIFDDFKRTGNMEQTIRNLINNKS